MSLKLAMFAKGTSGSYAKALVDGAVRMYDISHLDQPNWKDNDEITLSSPVLTDMLRGVEAALDIVGCVNDVTVVLLRDDKLIDLL